MSAIGPSLPPHLLAKRKRQQEEHAGDVESTTSTPTLEKRQRVAGPEEEQDDTNGSSANSTVVGPSLPQPDKRKIVGPAMPPASLNTRPATAHDDQDDSDDDDLGPALPGSAVEQDYAESNSELEDAGKAAVNVVKQKRDDWMTMAPTQDGLARMDPAKLRARGFNTGKSAKAPSNDSAQAWNETAEQRQKRLADEVLGVSTSSASPRSNRQHANKEKAQRDEEIARRIRDKAEKARGPSLMDQHNEGKDVIDDDPSKRAFDREKDMGNASRITGSQKREMISKAAGYSSRFAGGSFL